MNLFQTAPLRAVAWDFDGVLNANVDRGTYLWSEHFEADFGVPIETFQNAVFSGDGLDRRLTGAEDVIGPISEWCATYTITQTPEQVLQYWLDRDYHPDAAMLGMVRRLEKRGIRQVIATNADPRRAAWVEGLRDQFPGVEAVFASGQMGLRKPDPAFYKQMAETLDLPPPAIFVVDDTTTNVNAAAKLGFRTFQYSVLAQDNLRRALGS